MRHNCSMGAPWYNCCRTLPEVLTSSAVYSDMFSQLICFVSLLTTVKMYRDYSSPFNDPCGFSATQVHDGDIAYYLTATNNGDRVKRGATSVRERLWPDGRIPFKISPGHHKPKWIYEAMRVWENATCIRFYERPETHNESYVYFFRGGCCASYVGRQTEDLQQGVSLGYSCNKFSTYLHEIGHAIGFWHEHSRPDRDMYIKVLMQNVNPNARNNFRIVEQINSLGIGYDYNSIMHYSSDVFGGGRTTMMARDPSIPLGLAVDLSDLDILQTNLLYQCDMDNPPPSDLPPPCPPTPASTTPPLPACGQDFTEYEGYFFSPGYPSPYPPNQTCVYRITLPKGTRLVIVIADLHMDWTPYNTCTKDNLTIYKTNDGSGYRQWSRCGGSSDNITIPMDKSIAYVEFISDADNIWEGMRGFAAYYKGDDIDECQEDNGGCSQICVDEVPGYQCSCRGGWFLSGDDHTCFDMNECAVGNGGCEHKCNNTGGSFYCDCPEGCILNSDGRTCSNPEASCGTKNGGCDHNCNESSSGVICSCNSGYRLLSDGVTCRDIDECLINNTCSYGGCRNTDGSYTCVCESGYEIDSENSNCTNVDECLLGIHLCRGGAQCRDTEGSYECTCRIGFKPSHDGLSCIDVNECLEKSGICSYECVNTIGSYQCICPPGYNLTSVSSDRTISNHSGSGVNTTGYEDYSGSSGNCSENTSSYATPIFTCEDIDECTLYGGCSHIAGANCNNTPGSYNCICRPGYTLSGSECEDVNECVEGGCSNITDSVCVNTPGSYECNCRAGFTLNGSVCKDVDECTNGGCFDIAGTICNNTPGSYNCICRPGFTLSGSKCEDVNECVEGGCSNITDSVCVNTPGSYECNCRAGFTLNGSVCKDVDECTNGGCFDIAGTICNNTPGSYNCICRPGFTLSGSECEDVNECVEGGCSNVTDSVCVNTPGSYECKCHAGFRLNASVCKDMDECTNGRCSDIAGTICHNILGSYECLCNPGYRLSGSHCEDINECLETIHNCESGCSNSNGSYTCTCPTDYMLAPDGHSCQCGGIFTEVTGKFSTPGWPHSYPREDFQCEWIINLTTPNSTIHFTINGTAYGINGRHPCPTDYLQFFDGTHEDAETMFKLCKFDRPSEPIVTSTSEARVIFRGSRKKRPPSRVGVQVMYSTLQRRTGSSPPIPVNECLTENGGCQHICTDTPSSFNCSCRPGYSLNDDGRTCRIDCGGELNETSGSFQTPDWPDRYPQADFTCIWTIRCPSPSHTIRFTVDREHFGINGRPPCTDHLQFFRGPGRTNPVGNQICFLTPPTAPIVISCPDATVVFTGHLNRNRPPSRVGVKVYYDTV